MERENDSGMGESFQGSENETEEKFPRGIYEETYENNIDASAQNKGNEKSTHTNLSVLEK